MAGLLYVMGGTVVDNRQYLSSSFGVLPGKRYLRPCGIFEYIPENTGRLQLPAQAKSCRPLCPAWAARI